MRLHEIIADSTGSRYDDEMYANLAEKREKQIEQGYVTVPMVDDTIITEWVGASIEEFQELGRTAPDLMIANEEIHDALIDANANTDGFWGTEEITEGGWSFYIVKYEEVDEILLVNSSILSLEWEI